MAQSTAEELAEYLPHYTRSKTSGLSALLWKRNRGYLNRKSTSLFFDLLEVVSLAMLADVESLKFFYIIWIIFYFSQSVLESLFYSARKIYVYEKKIPTKRILAYVHILIVMIPLFFTMVSFEKFSQNNIAIIYLLYKAVLLTIQIFFNFVSFEMQTLTRIYYPPLLNWGLLVASFGIIILVQNYCGPIVSLYMVMLVLGMAKLTQDLIIFKKIKSLRTSLLWQLKRDKIEDRNSIMEFFTLISIEIFLPISMLSLPNKVINIQNMAYIFLTYMIVKFFLRPIRSLTLDHWNLGIKENKILLLTTYLMAVITTLLLILLSKVPTYAIFVGFSYFNLLIIWNTKLTNNRNILLAIGVTFTWAALGINLVFLPALHAIAFSFLSYIKFKTPRNLKKYKKTTSFENKFLLTFKDRPRWVKMARLYPDLTWSPISKKRCILESNTTTSELQKFIFENSFEIHIIEKMDLKLAKKFNLS
jgi:hypothetical protein